METEKLREEILKYKNTFNFSITFLAKKCKVSRSLLSCFLNKNENIKINIQQLNKIAIGFNKVKKDFKNFNF